MTYSCIFLIAHQTMTTLIKDLKPRKNNAKNSRFESEDNDTVLPVRS